MFDRRFVFTKYLQCNLHTIVTPYKYFYNINPLVLQCTKEKTLFHNKNTRGSEAVYINLEALQD